MAAGPVSLKNLTKCEEVRKGADQAIYMHLLFTYVSMKYFQRIV